MEFRFSIYWHGKFRSFKVVILKEQPLASLMIENAWVIPVEGARGQREYWAGAPARGRRFLDFAYRHGDETQQPSDGRRPFPLLEEHPFST